MGPGTIDKLFSGGIKTILQENIFLNKQIKTVLWKKLTMEFPIVYSY